MTKVDLHGLKVYHVRGKWFVYRRSTGEALIKSFAGSRAELDRQLASPNFIATYNRPRIIRTAATFPADTLGGLVQWFTCGDIDRKTGEPECSDGFPKWRQLSDATRKDYLAAFDYLRPEFDIALADITTPDLYDLRDKCANAKWPRFADKMISALSSMFGQGVKRGKMERNPCAGMDKGHQADPNANREWLPEEFKAAFDAASSEIKTVLVLARYGGLRGQSIVKVGWRQYLPHQRTGMAIQLITRKNKEPTFIPALTEMQAYLGSLARTSTLIAVRDDGTTWPNEKDMQTKVSHWLRDRERDGLIGAGTTLHGLRVSYAAWWKRNGATDAEIADLLGDKSVRMGTHYTRHVSREDNVIRAFDRLKKP